MLHYKVVLHALVFVQGITLFFSHVCVTVQRESSVDITVSPLDEGVTYQDGLFQFLKVNGFDKP